MGMAGLWETWRVGGRKNLQLHDRHHQAERIVRRTPQPDARGAETGRMEWHRAGGRLRYYTAGRSPRGRLGELQFRAGGLHRCRKGQSASFIKDFVKLFHKINGF
jgi:hypothetical protein